MGVADVRLGSLADIAARSRHVRFTPDSGHSSVQVGCPPGRFFPRLFCLCKHSCKQSVNLLIRGKHLA